MRLFRLVKWFYIRLVVEHEHLDFQNSQACSRPYQPEALGHRGFHNAPYDRDRRDYQIRNQLPVMQRFPVCQVEYYSRGKTYIYPTAYDA